MVIGPPTIRLIVPLGWAASLLVLSTVEPAARACPILMEQSATTLASDLVIGPIKTGCVWDQNEETQPAIANKLSSSDERLNTFDIGAAELNMADDPEARGTLTQSLISITRLALDSSTRSDHVSLRFHTTPEDYAAERDVAVDMYYAMYNINPDLAFDLLSSYRAINRIGGDIAGAMEGPLNAIGFSGDSAVTQINVTSTELTDANGHHKIIGRRNDIDMIARWIRFLLSLDALPYYILISSVVIIFLAISTARSPHS